MLKARQQVGEGGDSILSSDLRVHGRRKVAGEGTFVERWTAQLGRRVGFFGERDSQSWKDFGSAFPVRSRVRTSSELCAGTDATSEWNVQDGHSRCHGKQPRCVA